MQVFKISKKIVPTTFLMVGTIYDFNYLLKASTDNSESFEITPTSHSAF